MTEGRKRGLAQFLTVHALILLYFARHPEQTQHQIAMALGFTDNWVNRAFLDMEDAGIIEASKVGRRVYYSICPDALLGNEALGVMTVGQFIRAFQPLDL
jgi:DNA-binding MarR family transcriptional regulator